MPSGYSPMITDIYMSHGACSAYCKTSQYRYAFTFGGNACYCSNERPPEENKVEEAKCRKPCAGYPLEMCGSPLPSNPTQPGLQQPDNQSQAGKEPGDLVYANAILIGSTLPKSQPQLPVPATKTNPDTITKITSTGVRPEERQVKASEVEEKQEGEDKDDEDEGEIPFIIVRAERPRYFKYRLTNLPGVTLLCR